MLFVEEEAVLSIEDPGAGGVTDEIPNRVATNCRCREDWDQGVHIQVTSCGQEAGRNEERITGKKYSDEKPGLGENDRRDPEESGPLDELRKVGKPVEKIGDW